MMISRQNLGRRLFNVITLKTTKSILTLILLVMTLPKKMFSPEEKYGGKGFELDIVCPKLLSSKVRLTSTNDVNNNSNQVTSFKEDSDKLHVAHD